MKKVSVIMSVYGENYAQLTTATSSILAQEYPHLEFVIVLDNPENLEAKLYLQRLAAHDERVVIIENESNIQLGASLNKAIDAATGSYIARMDADDSCQFPKRLAKQVAYIEKHPDVDLLFTWWEESEKGQVMRSRTPEASLADDMKKSFFTRSFLLHPTLMAKRQVLVDHPYPETARPEDLMLFLKLIRLDYRFAILEEVLYTYTVDQLDSDTRYRKVRTYSQTFLPYLLRQMPYFSFNMYYWWYVSRLVFEYITSRQKHVFQVSHGLVTRIVRLLRK